MLTRTQASSKGIHVPTKEKAEPAETPEFALDLNRRALELRKVRRFDEAAALLCRAIGIEDRLLMPDHPKRAHRRNNLAIVWMLADQLDEAERINAAAWWFKACQHDMTSGRILFARIALRWLRNAYATNYLGQLRTLLLQPELSCLGEIDRKWDADDVLDHLRSRLASEKADLLAAIVAALNEPGKVADLERFALWKSAPAVPLDLPWEILDILEPSVSFAKFQSSAPYSKGFEAGGDRNE
jgi:hypothetical protein